jgi:nucleotide-binding universal stress UspA family protein
MPDKSIMVGVDGSTSAAHAVRWTATEAQRRSLPMRLVHASEIPVGYPLGMVDPHPGHTNAASAPAGAERRGRAGQFSICGSRRSHRCFRIPVASMGRSALVICQTLPVRIRLSVSG